MDEHTEESPASTPSAPQPKSIMPLVLIGLVAVIALAGFGFMSMQRSTDSTVQTTEGMDESVTQGQGEEGATGENAMAENTDAVSIIEVEGGSFYYKSNEIRVKVGQPVTIRLNSVDMMHDFVIDELDVESEIANAGTSTEVTFTPDTAGEYEFYCSVGQHRANGMVGTLIVE